MLEQRRCASVLGYPKARACRLNSGRLVPTVGRYCVGHGQAAMRTGKPPRSAAVQWRESVALCARLRACGRKAAATARRDSALVALPLGLCGSRAVLTPPSKQEEELFNNRFAACVPELQHVAP